MSLLAGFDIAIEVSNETVLTLVKGNLKVEGVAASPPFQVILPVKYSGLEGSVALLVEDLSLDINSDNSLSLDMPFDKTSVTVDSPISVTISPLDGSIDMKIPLLLIDSGPMKMALAVDLPKATVSVTFSAASNMVISDALSKLGLPFSSAEFGVLASQAFADFMHGMGQYVTPFEFAVVPNVDGSIDSRQVERLELTCVGDTDKKKQALCFLGTLLTANHSLGNPNLKTSSAIDSGHDICVSLSPSAFHSYFFCPSLASTLNAKVSDLPTTCGQAAGFDTQGVTVRSISESFEDGHIDIDAAIEASGPCYVAHVTCHGALTFSIVYDALTPKLAVDNPKVNVDVPWYCWLAIGILGGPIGLVSTDIIRGLGEDLVKNLAPSMIKGALGKGIPSIVLPDIGGITLQKISITSEGLTIQALRPYIYIPTPDTTRFWLTGSVVPAMATISSSGTFHTRFIGCDIDKDYPYNEWVQVEKAVYTAYWSMLTPPVSLQWEIRVPKGASGTADVYPLTGQSGTVSFKCLTDYPLPLPGGSSVVQVVHVDYSMKDNTVLLTNRMTEGDFTFYLYAHCVDGAGSKLEAFQEVVFDGDIVKFEGGFYEDQQACLAKFAQSMRKRVAFYPKPIPPDLIPPIDYPPPELIARAIIVLASSGVPEAHEALLNMKAAYGTSFYRGLYSKAVS